MPRILLLLLTVVVIQVSEANAAYTTINLSTFANASPDRGEGSYPTGTTMGNLGSPVPFLLSGSNGVLQNYISQSSTASSTLNLTGLGLTGQTTFYALLNNYFGTYGLDEYDITISTVQGPSVTYQSIGGVDTRDFNANVFTNTLASTTLPWFDNGVGQRLDLRQFTLPTSFAADTISGFTITQNGNNDVALFSGLTFSTLAGIVPTNPVATPEPASLALVSAGLLGLLGLRRRSRG